MIGGWIEENKQFRCIVYLMNLASSPVPAISGGQIQFPQMHLLFEFI